MSVGRTRSLDTGQLWLANCYEFSVAFQTWILNYFVNGSRGWMMTCNVPTNVHASFSKVITRATQMDFSRAIGLVTAELLGPSSSLSTVRSTRGESSSCGSVVGSSGGMQDGQKESSGCKKGFTARGCRCHLVTTSRQLFLLHTSHLSQNIGIASTSIPRSQM